MSTTTRARFQAAIVAIGPAILPASGIVTSRVLSRNLTWLVVGALVVMAATRFVPLGAALYVGSAAAVVALWPLAYEMWRRPEAARPDGQPQPMPATFRGS